MANQKVEVVPFARTPYLQDVLLYDTDCEAWVLGYRCKQDEGGDWYRLDGMDEEELADKGRFTKMIKLDQIEVD